MIVRIFLALAFFTSTAHAADFDRSLNISGPADLFVSTSSGRIQVVPSAGNTIQIRAHVYSNWRGGTGGDLEQRIRQISEHPPIQQSGNSIHIGDSAADRALLEHITIDYQINLPRESALYLHSGSGDIEVDNVGRSLKADSGSGSVRAHNLSGPADLHADLETLSLRSRPRVTSRPRPALAPSALPAFQGRFKQPAAPVTLRSAVKSRALRT